MAICRGENMKKDEIQSSELRQMMKDALRYRRLRILGAAPGGSIQVVQGTVLRFATLDKAIDEDISTVPNRGDPLGVGRTEGPGHRDRPQVRHHRDQCRQRQGLR
jgi:hypothetical protein